MPTIQPTVATLLLEPGEDTGPVVNMTFMPSAAGCPLEADPSYAPKRRRAAWHEGHDEDLAQARRVAAAIADALDVAGYRISRNPSAPHHSTP